MYESAHTRAWRSEVELWCLLLSLSTLSFEAGSLTQPGAHKFSYTHWPVRPQDPPVSASQALGFSEFSTMCGPLLHP